MMIRFALWFVFFTPILSVRLARYKVAITKQKDSEQTSSSLYNQNDMWAPAVDFSNYIKDNESIDNQVRGLRRRGPVGGFCWVGGLHL